MAQSAGYVKGYGAGYNAGRRRVDAIKNALAAALQLLEEEIKETDNLKMQIATFEAGAK